jgi:hypothetical protein
MNLNNNPTLDQLRGLLERCDDSAGSHVLWVKNTGEVQLSLLAPDQSSVAFQQAHPDAQIRVETFLAGNEYVGSDAAADQEWVSELFERLVTEWSRVKGRPDGAYIGNF